MRVLMIVDTMFALRERRMLRRLEVGLADEGVRVTWCVPHDAAGIELGDWFTRTIAAAKGGPFVGRATIAREVIEEFEELAGGEIDAVHVFGGRMWDLGLEIGEVCEAPVMLEVWREGLAQRARSLRPVAGTGLPILLAPGKQIERKLRDLDCDAPVRLAPWGVHAQAKTRALESHRALSVHMTGTGREPAAFGAAFEGVIRALPEDREVLVFADADAAKRSSLWKLAGRLRVTDRVSLIDDMEGRRELVLRGDLLVQPEAHGEHRSLLLDAMGHGMAVVARRDPAIDYLIAGVSASLVDGSNVTDWTDHVRPLLASPDELGALRRSAREYVAQHHRASSQVMAVLNAYHWATSSESIPLRRIAGRG